MNRRALAGMTSRFARIIAIAAAAGAADGMLVEPFYLIPIFWLLAVIGAACWMISVLTGRCSER